MNQPEKTNSGSVVWIAVIAAVVVLGVVAVLASRGGGGSDEASTTTPASVAADQSGGDSLPAFEATQGDAAVGQPIPTVSGVDLAGESMSIGADGTAKVIVFVAHWCPHCQVEVPVIVDHLKTQPMPDDVELVTVSTSVKPEADNYPPSKWLESEGWQAPVLADDDQSSAAAAFGLTSFPYFVAVEADGKVVARASGELTTDQFDALVTAAQTGTPI